MPEILGGGGPEGGVVRLLRLLLVQSLLELCTIESKGCQRSREKQGGYQKSRG